MEQIKERAVQLAESSSELQVEELSTDVYADYLIPALKCGASTLL